jgi:flagellar basal-body rod protein FlgB
MGFDSESMTIAAVSTALDAAVLRQQVLAANIANASTVGYVPRRLSFEAEFARAAGAGRTAAEDSSALQWRARVEPDLGADGAPRRVQIDEQMVELARNSVHFQALVKGLNRHLSILAAAVSEGRR